MLLQHGGLPVQERILTFKKIIIKERKNPFSFFTRLYRGILNEKSGKIGRKKALHVLGLKNIFLYAIAPIITF